MPSFYWDYCLIRRPNRKMGPGVASVLHHTYAQGSLADNFFSLPTLNLSHYATMAGREFGAARSGAARAPSEVRRIGDGLAHLPPEPRVRWITSIRSPTHFLRVALTCPRVHSGCGAYVFRANSKLLRVPVDLISM